MSEHGSVARSPLVARPPIDWGDPAEGDYTIRDLVQLSAVPASSIHHYRRLGLIPEPSRSPSNQYRYDDRHVTALTMVRSLRRRGCSLDEIRDVMGEFLRGRDGGCSAMEGLELTEQVGDRTPETKLIDAAIAEFAVHGFHEVSIAALCERADVAKGTFYRCFDSKEDVFLAAARAIIERAIDGFDQVAGSLPESERPAAFATHLRPGLPVLFELAKRLTQESGPSVSEAVTLFAGLARRLGRVVQPSAADDQAEAGGGWLIMLSLVAIFEDLLASEITGARFTPPPLEL
ncbi:MerR family transcriptional regulator [Desertimonas flava]|jgi:AcrR family transcriptional regulator|uniref:MerR family transcriptional regulator n=1 Tax=Desertimonas flava TaxID=2064846 RepID=UPI0013C4176F|nr:TetR family transcriptional regulator [Desertimonas flava]